MDDLKKDFNVLLQKFKEDNELLKKIIENLKKFEKNIKIRDKSYQELIQINDTFIKDLDKLIELETDENKKEEIKNFDKEIVKKLGKIQDINLELTREFKEIMYGSSSKIKQ